MNGGGGFAAADCPNCIGWAFVAMLLTNSHVAQLVA
jgi:hypothetical protein